MGVTVSLSNSFYNYISGITTAVSYYSACQIFRVYDKKEIFYLKFTNIVKSFLKVR